MINPNHEIKFPIDKPVSAQFLADFALEQWREAMDIVFCSRQAGNHDDVAFFLADAAEWRRVFAACKEAVSVMGGL